MRTVLIDDALGPAVGRLGDEARQTRAVSLRTLLDALRVRTTRIRMTRPTWGRLHRCWNNGFKEWGVDRQIYLCTYPVSIILTWWNLEALVERIPGVALLAGTNWLVLSHLADGANACAKELNQL